MATSTPAQGGVSKPSAGSLLHFFLGARQRAPACLINQLAPQNKVRWEKRAHAWLWPSPFMCRGGYQGYQGYQGLCVRGRAFDGRVVGKVEMHCGKPRCMEVAVFVARVGAHGGVVEGHRLPLQHRHMYKKKVKKNAKAGLGTDVATRTHVQVRAQRNRT